MMANKTAFLIYQNIIMAYLFGKNFSRLYIINFVITLFFCIQVTEELTWALMSIKEQPRFPEPAVSHKALVLPTAVCSWNINLTQTDVEGFLYSYSQSSPHLST
jgi:hypothetical protein